MGSMATIVQTPSGKWKAVIRKNGWPTTIKTWRLKRDADDWARRTEDEMARGVFIQRVESERTTISQALDRYVREVTPTKAASTQISERRRAEVLKRHLGRYTLASLTAKTVADYRDKRLSGEIEGGPNSRKPGPKAGNTVRLELALLGHLYQVATREWGFGMIPNPVQHIRKPPAARHRQRRLDRDEQVRLFRELEKHSNPMLAWIAKIALETGMRSSEISTLERHQVDLRRRIVRLTKTKNGDDREVPLSQEATEVFRQALANPVRPIDSKLIFFGEPGRDGVRRRYEFNKLWTAAKTAAGLKDFRFHDMRHEAGSRLAEGGMDSRKIAAILGHKDMKMSIVYVNLYGRDLVDEVETALNYRRSRGL
jgi:integrase